MRIQKLHPSLVHFPIALSPTSLMSDALGRLFADRRLMEVGRRLLPAVAVCAALASLAGLIAQEAVRTAGRAHETLTTHRNLNLGVTVLTSMLASVRARHRRPSHGYLQAGFAAAAALAHTASLGGKMVCEHGVRVRSAGGLNHAAAPEIRRDTLPDVARTSSGHIVRGLKHTAMQLLKARSRPHSAEDDASHRLTRGTRSKGLTVT